MKDRLGKLNITPTSTRGRTRNSTEPHVPFHLDTGVRYIDLTYLNLDQSAIALLHPTYPQPPKSSSPRQQAPSRRPSQSPFHVRSLKPIQFLAKIPRAAKRRLRPHAHEPLSLTSWLVMQSQTPSHARTTKRSCSVISSDRTSGSAVII